MYKLSGVQLSGEQLSGGQLSGEQLSGGQSSGGQLSGEQLLGGHLSGGQLSALCEQLSVLTVSSCRCAQTGRGGQMSEWAKLGWAVDLVGN